MPLRVMRRILIACVGVVLVLAAAVGASTYFFSESFCANDLLAESASPDGKLKAVVFERDCGATTGFSTQVSILPATAPIDNSVGNVFTSDTNHGVAPPGPGGGPVVKVNWQSPSVLVVSHHAAARVFVAESQVGSVMVSYEQLQQ